MSLLYVAIANEKSIVCSHALANRDFSNSVHSCLSQKLDEGPHYYLEGQVGVHVLIVSGICFVAICTVQTPRQQPVQFLIKLAERFASSSLRVSQAKQGSAECLQHSYGGSLKSFCLTFDQYQTNLQMSALQSDIAGVTNVLRQNVQDLIRRGDLASNLADKTADLESDSRLFETYSKKVERKERYANLRMKFIIGGVVAAIVLVILLIILWQCGVFNKH